jgi:hypothetical protein
MKTETGQRNFKTIIILAAIGLGIAGIVSVIIWDINTSSSRKNKIAIQGYDTVAFFRKGKPVKGKRHITYNWNRLIWRFCSMENRDLFIADPARYAPQYGGNCAFTTSLGKAQRGLAKYWQIRDSKLYLNSNLVSQFLWKRWPNRIKVADKHWIRLTSRPKD